MSDTPRTDDTNTLYVSHAYDANGIVCATVEHVSADFARELERGLNEAKRSILKIHKDYGCEIRDPNGTIWEHAAKLQEQNDALRKEIKSLRGY